MACVPATIKVITEPSADAVLAASVEVIKAISSLAASGEDITEDEGLTYKLALQVYRTVAIEQLKMLTQPKGTTE